MLRIRRTIIILLTMMLIITLIQSINAADYLSDKESTSVNELIFYVSNCEEIPKTLLLGNANDGAYFNITQLSMDDTDKMLSQKIMWIDYPLITTKSIKDILLKRYDEGLITVLVGDDIDKGDVIDYFGIDNPYRNYYVADGFSLAGFTVQEVEGIGVVCGVQYLFTDKETTVYHPLADASIIDRSSMIENQIFTYNHIAYDSSVATCGTSSSYVKLYTNFNLYKEPTPVNNRYFFFYKSRSEIDVVGNYHYHRALLHESELSSTIVEDYEFNSTTTVSNNSSISIPFFGLSISVLTGPRTYVSKAGGGLGNYYVDIRYNPVTTLGLSLYSHSDGKYDSGVNYNRYSTSNQGGMRSKLPIYDFSDLNNFVYVDTIDLRLGN